MVQQTMINGLASGDLKDCIDSVTQSPELGKYTFKAKNKWVNGAHCKTEICQFEASGNEVTRDKTHVMEGDEPVQLLGTDEGPNATEALLHALGACLNASFIYQATNLGIQIDELEIDIDGYIDLNGFLGTNHQVRNGFQSIDVTFRVKSDAPEDKIRDLCDRA